MDPDQIFINTLTEKTGITYNKIMEVFKESGLDDKDTLCELFMKRFQMSYGFASTLAEIVISKGVNT